jgi:hypothetical protein
MVAAAAGSLLSAARYRKRSVVLSAVEVHYEVSEENRKEKITLTWAGFRGIVVFTSGS